MPTFLVMGIVVTVYTRKSAVPLYTGQAITSFVVHILPITRLLNSESNVEYARRKFKNLLSNHKC